MLKNFRFMALHVFMMGSLLLANSSPAASQTKPSRPVAGEWQGTLQAASSKLRVVFHVAVSDSGTLAGTLDSPDQGAFGIPVSSVTVTGDSIEVVIPAISGSYDGRLSADNSTIEGKWKQAGAAFDLKLSRSAEKITMNRPQEPKPPFPYKSEDVTFRNSEQGIKLAGTLTTPQGSGPFPAAILITGSGPENRDEELFGHKIFLVIADYLTRRGIAVLRYDDRGVGGSTGGRWDSYTTADYATDVTSAISFLKGRSEIDTSKIGLIGHSEGGIIGPMVASKSPDVAFVVMLAGTGCTGAELLPTQVRLLEAADGTPAEKVEADVAHMEKIASIAGSGRDSVEIANELKDYLLSTYSEWGADFKKSGADSTQMIERQVSAFDAPWFRFFMTYDPIPALERVKCPVLAMGGSLDFQVPAEDNLTLIGNALKKGGNRDYTTRLMPELNHVFQHATTGSESEYSRIEETFSPDALKLVGDWITERMK